MRLKFGRALCPLLVSLFLACDASADPYTILPNGDLIFNTAVNTAGRLGCFDTGQWLTCTGSGSEITLWSGAEWLRFSFTGTSVTTGVGNVTVPIDLGTIEGTSSPGFEFPSATNPNASLFVFSLSLLQSSPTASMASVGWGFGKALSRFGGMDYLQTSAGPNPPGYNYPAIIFTFRPSAFQLSQNGTTHLVADVGAVPEPRSFVLLATGLAVVFVRRRKRPLVLEKEPLRRLATTR